MVEILSEVLPALLTHKRITEVYWTRQAPVSNRTERSVSVNMGDTTVLRCDHDQENVLLLTWKVKVRSASECIIAYDLEENTTVTYCSARLRMDNVSLHISDTKLSDEGMYECEIASAHDILFIKIHLQVLAEPLVILSLTSDGLLECQALSGNPAASIFWIPEPSYASTTTQQQPNMTWTTRSTYSAENISLPNVTCVVSHPTFRQNKSIAMNGKSFSMWFVLPITFLSCVLLLSLIVWKRSNIRKCFKMDVTSTAPVNQTHCNPQTNSNSTSKLDLRVDSSSTQLAKAKLKRSKSNPGDHFGGRMVEEVEPYASFTQKVNTIYNSLPELSKPDKIYWTVDQESKGD
ncbi:cell surface glycoprotein CD200 receptor 1-B-like [Pelodytes ibericus]